MYRKHILLIFLSLLLINTFAQLPTIVLQKNIGINCSKMYKSENEKYILLEEGSVGKEYTLIDAVSNIQIGHLKFGNDGFGAHQTILLNDGTLYAFGKFWIWQADPKSGTIRKIFNILDFPEIITGFAIHPNDTAKLIIGTKIYPSKGSTPFIEQTNKGRLLIFDIIENKIVQSKELSHNIHEIRAYKDVICYGTNKGTLEECSLSLESIKTHKVFKGEGIGSIDRLPNKNWLVTNALQPTDIQMSVGSKLAFIGNEIKYTEFKKQAVPKPYTKYIKPDPDNQIRTILFYKNHLIVHNGYSRISKLSFDGNTIDEKVIKDIGGIGTMTKGPNDNLLYITFGKVVLAGGAKNFGMLNFNSEKLVYQSPEFKKNDEVRLTSIVKSNNHTAIFYRKPFGRYNDPYIFNTTNCNKTIKVYTGGNKLISDGQYYYLYSQSRYLRRSSIYKFELDLSKSISDSVFLRYEKPNYYSKDSLVCSEPVITSQTILFDSDNFDSKNGEYSVNRVVMQLTPDSSILILNKEQEPRLAVLYKNQVQFISNFCVTNSIKFSVNNRYIAFKDRKKRASLAETLHIYDLRKGKELWKSPIDYIMPYNFDATNNSFLYGKDLYDDDTTKQTFFIIDLNNSSSLKEIVFPMKKDSYLICTDLRHNRVLYQRNNFIILAKASNLQIIKKWKNSGFPKISYSYQLNCFVIKSESKVSLINKAGDRLDFESYEKEFKLMTLNETYYWANKELLNQLSYLWKGNGYGVSNFDFHFNRPDKILNFFSKGKKQSTFEKLVCKAVEKRMGYYSSHDITDKFKVNLSSVEVLNLRNLPNSTTSNKIRLQIRAISSRDSVTLYVKNNGVNIFGYNHKQIPTNEIISIDVLLLNGNNEIEVYISENEIQSLRKRKNILYIDKEPKPANIYFVPISVAQYKDSIYNLSYATKDGKDLNKLLSDKFEGKITSLPLFDEDVKINSIHSVAQKLQQVKENDIVIMFLSGHGVLDEDYNWWYATHDMDFNKPQAKGWSYDSIIKLLGDIKSRKKMLFLDACHSGKVDKVAYTEDKIINKKVKFRGVLKEQKFINSKGDSTKLIEQQGFELQQQLFVDFGNTTGAHVITGATGSSFAYETEELQNGIFTFALREALTNKSADLNKDGKVQYSEIKEYIMKRIPVLSNGRQTPTTREENIQFDFTIE